MALSRPAVAAGLNYGWRYRHTADTRDRNTASLSRSTYDTFISMHDMNIYVGNRPANGTYDCISSAATLHSRTPPTASTWKDPRSQWNTHATFSGSNRSSGAVPTALDVSSDSIGITIKYYYIDINTIASPRPARVLSAALSRKVRPLETL